MYLSTLDNKAENTDKQANEQTNKQTNKTKQKYKYKKTCYQPFISRCVDFLSVLGVVRTTCLPNITEIGD